MTKEIYGVTQIFKTNESEEVVDDTTSDYSAEEVNDFTKEIDRATQMVKTTEAKEVVDDTTSDTPEE